MLLLVFQRLPSVSLPVAPFHLFLVQHCPCVPQGADLPIHLLVFLSFSLSTSPNLVFVGIMLGRKHSGYLLTWSLFPYMHPWCMMKALTRHLLLDLHCPLYLSIIELVFCWIILVPWHPCLLFGTNEAAPHVFSYFVGFHSFNMNWYETCPIMWLSALFAHCLFASNSKLLHPFM